MAITSEGCPSLIIAGTKRLQADLQLVSHGYIGVPIAQESADGRQFSDSAQDVVAVPGSDVVAIRGEEGVALSLGEPEADSLESRDEVDLARAGACCIPVG